MLASHEEYRATKYNLFHPTIRLATGSYSWSISKDEAFHGLEDLFLKNYNYSVSLSASMPIFNMNTTNSLKKQKLQYLQSQENLDDAKRQKKSRIKKTYLSLKQHRRGIEASEVALEPAEENFRLEEENYNLGSGTFLERLSAQTRLFQARSNLVRSQYNYLIEMARLENETGISSTRDPDK